MRVPLKAGVFVAAFAVLLAMPDPAVAQERVTCESRNDRRETCRIRDLDEQSVRLVDRLSSSPCVNGRSWGTDRDEIWVDDGCRARFTYETGSRGGRRGELTCESHDGSLKNCRVPGLVENSVRLEKRLSSASCVNGRSWGTMPDIIWVESGCRAEFSFQSRGGGNRYDDDDDDRQGWNNNNNAGGTPSEFRDLIGVRASSGSSELEQRGFESRRSITTSNSRITYWYNSRRDQCIAVTTTDGEFAHIYDQPEAACRR